MMKTWKQLFTMKDLIDSSRYFGVNNNDSLEFIVKLTFLATRMLLPFPFVVHAGF